MAAKASVKSETSETREEAADGPLMDGFSAAVKKMIARGKEHALAGLDPAPFPPALKADHTRPQTAF